MIDIIKDHLTATPDTATPGKPDVVVLLDASGSMTPHRESVVSTFNEYVQSVKDTARSISLYTFDSQGVREKIFRESPARMRKLTVADYQPSAMTPLYDAMGLVMRRFDDHYPRLSQIQFVTHTDGLENASREWTYARLQEYIEILTHRGWLFVYLGEGLKGQEAVKDFSGLKFNYSAGLRGQSISNLSAVTRSYAHTHSNDIASYVSQGDTVNIDAGQTVTSLDTSNT